jgi:hypothetical protein
VRTCEVGARLASLMHDPEIVCGNRVTKIRVEVYIECKAATGESAEFLLSFLFYGDK